MANEITVNICPLCGQKHEYPMPSLPIPAVGIAKTAANVSEPKTTLIFNCPNKDKDFQGLLENGNVVSPSPITPQNNALLEAGKNILLESVSVGRDFCKEMITISSGAIAIYLGLLTFIRPEYFEKINLSFSNSFIALLPAFLFLAATLCFALGYYPRKTEFSLDVIDGVNGITNERTKMINNRAFWARLGFIAFSLGIAAAIIVTIMAPFFGSATPAQNIQSYNWTLTLSPA